MRKIVALRKESVDRNTFLLPLVLISPKVALRKESVDRNVFLTLTVRNVSMSLSARRAWIEMRKITITVDEGTSLSARRAWIEMSICGRWMALNRSLSARRAWIEMRKITITVDDVTVALRKESVDRNFYYADKDCDWARRSPQGERG